MPCLLAAATLVAIPAFAQKSYKLADRVKLGGEGGWDYLTYDPDGNRIFITRGNHVMVVDAKTLKPTGDITGLSGIHGVALAPELGRGFITSGGDNMLVIFDLKTLKVLDKVKVGERPDAILYDASAKRVYTFNAKTSGQHRGGCRYRQGRGDRSARRKARDRRRRRQGQRVRQHRRPQRDRAHRHARSLASLSTIPWPDATSPARWPSM